MSIQKANKNEVRKEIADLINRIKEQSDRIGIQREIPQSELDLILHRIEELHRKTVVWSYLNELPSSVAQDDTSPVQGSQFKILSSEAKNETPVETTKPAEPAPIPEPPKVVEEIKKPDPVPAPEPVVVKQTQPEPQKEPVKGPVVIETPKLKDIKSFIGFNEKLMYIRQVFKGDNAAYDAAITRFNSMTSWEEAKAFLSVLASEYKWGQHDEPVEIFTQTVKRRFS